MGSANCAEKIVSMAAIAPSDATYVLPIGQIVLGITANCSGGTVQVGDTWEYTVTKNANTGECSFGSVKEIVDAGGSITGSFTISKCWGGDLLPAGGRIRFVCTKSGTTGAEFRIDTYGFGKVSTMRRNATATSAATGAGNFGTDASGNTIAANGRATVVNDNSTVTFLIVEPIALEDYILMGYAIDQLASPSGIMKPIFKGTTYYGFNPANPTDGVDCKLTIVDGYGVTIDGTVITTSDVLQFVYRDVSAG